MTGDPMDNRIPTKLFIDANISRCQGMNIPVYIVKKGDPNSGMILLKILDADYKCRLFGQMRDMDGVLKWFDRTGDEAIPEGEAGQIAAALANSDPDLWVVEVETRDGKNPFDGDEIKL